MSMRSQQDTVGAKILDKLDLKAISQATPGFALRAYHQGQEAVNLTWGQTWSYYDLASLTKVIVTNTLMAAYIGAGHLDWDQPIGKYLPWFNGGAGNGHEGVIIKDLMRHRAGLPWWRGYYELIPAIASFSERMVAVKDMLSKETLVQPIKACYSDLDYILLGMLLAEVSGVSLDQAWQEFCDEVQLRDLFYHPGNQVKCAVSEYAPIEETFHRRGQLQGEVHDSNCWFLGGVTGHAGLFGTIQAVSDWLLAVRAAYLDLNKAGAMPESSIWRKFLERASPAGEDDWAWGWMMPSPGKSSCGRYFSPESSFGHTGFTGTSLWWDVEKDWMVILLANRYRPTHDNNVFARLRPEIHNVVYEVVFK